MLERFDVLLGLHYEYAYADGRKMVQSMVNEVVPRDRLIDRAWEIALQLVPTERITRRMSIQVLRRPWKKRVQDDLHVGWSSEMWAYHADEPRHRQARLANS